MLRRLSFSVCAGDAPPSTGPDDELVFGASDDAASNAPETQIKKGGADTAQLVAATALEPGLQVSLPPAAATALEPVPAKAAEPVLQVTLGLLSISILSAVTGEKLCTVRVDASDNVSGLRREVMLASASPGAFAFDLLFGEQVLNSITQLAAAGLKDHDTCVLVRRDINASDLVVAGYSERALGCISVTCKHTGAQLLLRGMRSGYEKTNVSLEYYTEPAWAEDTDDGVFVHYNKVRGEFRNGESITKLMKARRRVRLRSDMVIAEQADGLMWVDFKNDKDAPDSQIRNLFSGMRLQVLDSDEETLFVRTDREGDGWVRRIDVKGLGGYCLDWATQEVVMEEEQVDQRAAPNLYSQI